MRTPQDIVKEFVESKSGMLTLDASENKDKEGKPTGAWTFTVFAAGRRICRVIDPGNWPVMLEQAHADPQTLTVEKINTDWGLAALLVGMLESPTTKTILDRVPQPSPS